MDRNRLAIELRRDFGTRIDPDDPILAGAFVNRRMLDEAIAALEAAVKSAADRIAAEQIKANEDAEARAKAIITRAAEWLDDRWRETARQASESVLRELREEREKVAELSRAARRAGWIAGGCATLTAAGLAGWLIRALGLIAR
jgi:hypothetical protein